MHMRYSYMEPLGPCLVEAPTVSRKMRGVAVRIAKEAGPWSWFGGSVSMSMSLCIHMYMWWLHGLVSVDMCLSVK